MTTDSSKDKKKKGKKLLNRFIVVGLCFIGITGYGIYWAFFDMSRLPTGEYLTEATSPDGTYTVKTFVSSPSLSADAVRGELIFNERKDKAKNIYWNYRESTASIDWIDDDTVVINGHTLNVPKERFDFRRQ